MYMVDLANSISDHPEAARQRIATGLRKACEIAGNVALCFRPAQ